MILNTIADDLEDDQSLSDVGPYKIPFKEIVLKYIPIVDSITVTYGSQVIPFGYEDLGWTYNSEENKIIFGESVILDDSQPEGIKVKIQYNTFM